MEGESGRYCIQKDCHPAGCLGYHYITSLITSRALMPGFIHCIENSSGIPICLSGNDDLICTASQLPSRSSWLIDRRWIPTLEPWNLEGPKVTRRANNVTNIIISRILVFPVQMQSLSQAWKIIWKYTTYLSECSQEDQIPEYVPPFLERTTLMILSAVV